MTANDEPFPAPELQSRRSSLATSPKEVPTSAPSTSPAATSAATAVTSPPQRRALPPPPPPGPRNPLSPGTSRRTSYTIPAKPQPSSRLDVQYHVTVEPARMAYEAAPPAAAPAPAPTSPTTRAHTSVHVAPVPTPRSDAGSLPEYSYRSPEAVVEHVEDADTWTSSLPPGVLAVDENDEGGWGVVPSDSNAKPRSNAPAHGSMMDVDPELPSYTPERPQVGPGVMVRRFLEQIHPHPLYRPVITDLPQAAPLKTPVLPVRSLSTSDEGLAAAAPAPAPETEAPPPSLTLDEVYASLPGGKAQQNEWYFCPDCWGWFHISHHDVEDPPIIMPWTRSGLNDEAQTEFQKEMGWYRDLTTARGTSEHNDVHMHAFRNLVGSTAANETRIERINVPGHVDKFSHLELGEDVERYRTWPTMTDDPATLYASCTSDHWVFVDQGPVPGQLPVALVREFTAEKQGNPQPGKTANDSAAEAWSLVVTILANPLFRGGRAWIKTSNKTFGRAIGATLLSSHLMYQIGFAGTEGPEGYISGPFLQNELVSAESVTQMDQYMARTWVEVSLALQAFQIRNGLQRSDSHVGYKLLQDELSDWLNTSNIPHLSLKFEAKPLGPYLAALGVRDDDVVDTVSRAYDLQISDDHVNLPKYLGALEKLSNAHVPGVEALQIKVATDRSLDRYTLDDLDNAYARIGITAEHVTELQIDRDDFSNEVVLDYHRRAMDGADVAARSEIGRALGIIGKERDDPVMMRLARNGGVYLSLEQAYKEFNITDKAGLDDELLIMQYETWIQDRPSLADHYRMALSIIANAPGEERPVLQAYLQGKDVSEFQPPARRDIPTGLRNIGNTCYLNSVLQFLYAIKPVRDTVMAFEQTAPSVPESDETPKAMEKRVKVESSRRFVGLLRELFDEMYTTGSKAVVPKEELARLAILPVDLIGERKEAIPKSRVTIDSLPIVLSPDSSAAATAADSPVISPANSPRATSPEASPVRRSSILGKRASHDRESAFGGSEERLRRLTSSSEEPELIELDSGRASPVPVDVERSPLQREGSELTGLSQLGITSPLTEVGSISTEREAPTQPASEQTTPGPVPPPMGPPPLPPRREQHARRPSMALVAAEKFGLQQDAAEILINVLAQLEYAFEVPPAEGEASPNLISSLFSSKFRQQMLLQSADGAAAESHAPVESVFVHPIIGVEEDGKDLYDCLAELYLGGAEIEYEGKKGFKMDLVDELPPMLYIQMRRSQYDYAKRSQTKTNTHIPFDRTLVMDRFLAGAEPDKRERSITLTRDMMRMRARRHELKNHKPLSIPDTFRFVREALAADSTGSALGLTRESSADLAGMATDLSTDILDALEVEAVCADTEIADLETRLPQAKAALEALWSSSNEVEYELVSVFVHGGTGTGGHYWTYQAHLDTNADTNNTNNNKNNAFFYYSDETVKPVTADEVFADQSAQGVSPALLCYVRKNREIVDTLHREAAPLEGEDQQQQGQQQGQQEEQKRQQTQAGTADEPIALD